MMWQFCDLKGIKSKIPTSFQVDTVGNIYQQNGGVNPMACQKCKKKFKSVVQEVPLTQKVPSYKCNSCDFDQSSGDAAFLHKSANKNHNVIKVVKDRLVKIQKKTMTGIIPYIKVLKKDVRILCGSCSNGQS